MKAIYLLGRGREMPTRGHVTIEDYNGEKTVTSFWLQDIGAANFAAVTQDLDEVKDAIIPMIRGKVRSAGFTKEFPEDNTAVTDEEAARETKWLVTYRDTTQFLDVANTIANAGFGKLFNLEIGTAERTGHLVAGEDIADLTDVEVDALRDSLNANIRSPYNHTANAPTQEVLRIVYVGRNT